LKKQIYSGTKQSVVT